MRVLVVVALSAGSSWAIAQPARGLPPPLSPRPATIQVTGQAQVSESPDRVYIGIGVTTQAQQSEAAASQNAARLAAVIAAVKRAAGAGAQLTTTEYSINPNYDNPRDGSAPAVVGYTVSNVVQVRLDDLRKIGPVIDAATRAGSNNMQGIRFALRDEDAARDEALREAALKARKDAQTLAGAVGLRVVRVLSLNEQGPYVMPVYPEGGIRLFAQANVARAPTPVETGAIDVNATVTLTVEVAPDKR
jgi:hypothetical protein